MRKINAILGIIMTLLLVAHIIAGALLLSGITPGGSLVMSVLSWLLAAAVTAHIVIGIKLTADTVIAMKKSGVSYFKENKLFWIRRISGFAVMLFILPHIFVFTGTGGVFRLGLFDTVQLVGSGLMIISLLVHILSNIRPLIMALGAGKAFNLAADAAFVISVLLLLAGAAFTVYYVRWL